MESFDITSYKKGISVKKLQNWLNDNSCKIIIDYPMSYINLSNSNLDIMHNYIEASYIAEELGKYAQSIVARQIAKSQYTIICQYQITVKEIKPFIKRLRQLCIVLSDDQDDDDIFLEHQENLNEHAESLDDRLFLCPDLVDDYYANLINGAYFELDDGLDDGFLANEYKKYPEREFGFWKSAYSKTIGNDFYASRGCWIVPVEIDIYKLILGYSGDSRPETFEEALLFSLNNISYLAHQYGVVYFPFSWFLRAKNFVNSVLQELDIDNTNEHLLTYFPEIDEVKELYGIDYALKNSETKYLLSHSNESIIVENEEFRYVFFPDQIKNNKIAALYNEMSNVFGFVAEFAGVTKNVKLSWENFDDDKFEHLCYDIIYHQPEFNNRTIRKMGKSRSRDGGRDIEVYTKKRFGSPEKKYIFQCKFTMTGSSLTTRKVIGISDTIAQYDAQGYGVMTPVIIDAALYDRIDGICQKFKIESDNWSILEIERFIARNPNLKKRHFEL